MQLQFLSTPSARRATAQGCKSRVVVCISIHALREEGDGKQLKYENLMYRISIHALREEGDLPAVCRILSADRFLSTPSARRATSGYVFSCSCKCPISIHALREEGDVVYATITVTNRDSFLSTPSARRATALLLLSALLSHHFYPRPPRGGRRQLVK